MSGTAMLAVGFGRPEIAPAVGLLKELVDERCGLLYDPSDRTGLRDAMNAAFNARFDESGYRYIRK